jgi:hypothetical protein
LGRCWLGPVGIDRFNHVGAFLVGAAANPGVESQLKAIGVKYYAVTAGDIPQLADTVDKLYGSISNPDFGVATMPGIEDVVIGSMDGTDWQYALPATHWVAHMPTGLFWVHRDSIPSPTVDALKRRAGKARIYLFGGPEQISAKVASQLYQYGEVIRVSNDDPGRVQRASAGLAGGNGDRVRQDVGPRRHVRLEDHRAGPRFHARQHQ